MLDRSTAMLGFAFYHAFGRLVCMVSHQWSELIFGINALSIAKIQGLSLQLCRLELPKIQSMQKFACRLSVSTLLKILRDAWTVPRVYDYAVGKASTLEVDV